MKQDQIKQIVEFVVKEISPDVEIDADVYVEKFLARDRVSPCVAHEFEEHYMIENIHTCKKCGRVDVK